MATVIKSKKKQKQEPIEFQVPNELKLSPIHVKRVAIENESFVIEHDRLDKLDDENPHDYIRFQITGNYEEDMNSLRTWAKSNFFFIDNPDFMIDQLVNCVTAIYNSKEGSSAIANIKTRNEQEAQETKEKEGAKLKKQFIQKYYAKSENVLYESVLVSGKPYFVNQEWDVKSREPFARLSEKLLLPDAQHPRMELLPPDREQYLSKPYEFASEGELDKYLKLAAEQTLDKLYRTQKNLTSKYIDANDTHLTLIAADAIFTHFQDKLGQTHYDVFVGDNDTGKTANLVYLQYEGYRAMLDIDITSANIYNFLGNFEEGEGIILEDEADDIDRKPEKMKIYKGGYNAGKKVTRTDVTTFGRKTQGWNTFCFKAFTMEEAPDINKAKGFIDRSFVFHCARGDPAYDIQEVTNPAGDTEHAELLNELIHNRKLLFAYRLLHYQDPLPNIELSVKNREKQLCKPVLRLFQNSECQEQIGIALADIIAQKRGIKRDTIEAKILGVVTRMISNRQKEQSQSSLTEDDINQLVLTPLEPNQIPTAELFESVRMDLNGEYKRQGDKSFDTDEHGVVSHDKIRRICVDKFGAEPKRSTGGMRYFDFVRDKLEKAKTAYEFPDKVLILKKNVSESCSDTVPKIEPFSEYASENENVPDDEDGEKVVDNSTKEPQDIKKVEESEVEKAGRNSEKGDAHPKNDQNSGTLSLQDSELSVHKSKEEIVTEAVNKAMLDGQGHDKGYCTEDDFVFATQMAPNLHWTEDQAEQTFHALIGEGKLEEIEPGKYKPAAGGGLRG